jgi:hypothetical protein
MLARQQHRTPLNPAARPSPVAIPAFPLTFRLLTFNFSTPTHPNAALLATFFRENPQKASPQTLRSLPFSRRACHGASTCLPPPRGTAFPSGAFPAPARRIVTKSMNSWRSSPARTNANPIHIKLRRSPSNRITLPPPPIIHNPSLSDHLDLYPRKTSTYNLPCHPSNRITFAWSPITLNPSQFDHLRAALAADRLLREQSPWRSNEL